MFHFSIVNVRGVMTINASLVLKKRLIAVCACLHLIVQSVTEGKSLIIKMQLNFESIRRIKSMSLKYS